MNNVNPDIIALVDRAIALDQKRKSFELEIQKIKDQIEPMREVFVNEMQRVGKKELLGNKGKILWSDGRTQGKYDIEKLQEALNISLEELKESYYIKGAIYTRLLFKKVK